MFLNLLKFLFYEGQFRFTVQRKKTRKTRKTSEANLKKTTPDLKFKLFSTYQERQTNTLTQNTLSCNSIRKKKLANHFFPFVKCLDGDQQLDCPLFVSFLLYLIRSCFALTFAQFTSLHSSPAQSHICYSRSCTVHLHFLRFDNFNWLHCLSYWSNAKWKISEFWKLSFLFSFQVNNLVTLPSYLCSLKIKLQKEKYEKPKSSFFHFFSVSLSWMSRCVRWSKENFDVKHFSSFLCRQFFKITFY